MVKSHQAHLHLTAGAIRIQNIDFFDAEQHTQLDGKQAWLWTVKLSICSYDTPLFSFSKLILNLSKENFT